MTASLRPPRGPAARLHDPAQSSHPVRLRARGASAVSCDCGERWEWPRDRSTTPARRARCPPPRPGARCRSVRFFTHLPGAGPPPCKAGRPGRTHQGRPASGPASPASVRPPGHARPRTSQDTGQTTARRSRRRPTRPPRKCTQEKEKAARAGKRKGQEKHAGNSPGIAGEAQIISYN